MMKINRIKNNILTLESESGILLVSYDTPVAYQDKASGKFYRTSKNWSGTTTKHINWFVKTKADVMDQWFFDSAFTSICEGKELNLVTPETLKEA